MARGAKLRTLFSYVFSSPFRVVELYVFVGIRPIPTWALSRLSWYIRLAPTFWVRERLIIRLE